MLAFVYGTLTDPDRVATVVDEFDFEGSATLTGLRQVEGAYPTLVPPAGDGPAPEVEGRLLRTPDGESLDEFEGVERGIYVRVAVPLAGRDGTAAVYVGDPLQLGVEDPGGWPGTGRFAERVERYLDDHEVVVDPA